MPPITLALILLNILVYALELVTGPEIIRVFGLWPPGSAGAFHLWQLVTYSFLHGSLTHLGINMFAVWMFGAELERRWSDLRYLLTYLLSVVVAAITQIVVADYCLNSSGAVVGASGGVFGLLLAYALYFPRSAVSIIFLPFIRIPVRIFVLGYGVIELLLGLTGRDAGVAHFAHLGGAARWLAGGAVFPRARGLRQTPTLENSGIMRFPSPLSSSVLLLLAGLAAPARALDLAGVRWQAMQMKASSTWC